MAQSHSCQDTLLFVLGPVPHCTLATPGPVWDSENFLVGAPSGDLQEPLSPLAQQEALSAPQELVEVGRPCPASGHSLEIMLTLAAVCLLKTSCFFFLGLFNILCVKQRWFRKYAVMWGGEAPIPVSMRALTLLSLFSLCLNFFKKPCWGSCFTQMVLT